MGSAGARNALLDGRRSTMLATPHADVKTNDFSVRAIHLGIQRNKWEFRGMGMLEGLSLGLSLGLT